jgi:hypothetical protein
MKLGENSEEISSVALLSPACFPDIFHILGQIDPKIASLDQNLAYLNPKMGPNPFKNIFIPTGLNS